MKTIFAIHVFAASCSACNLPPLNPIDVEWAKEALATSAIALSAMVAVLFTVFTILFSNRTVPARVIVPRILKNENVRLFVVVFGGTLIFDLAGLAWHNTWNPVLLARIGVFLFGASLALMFSAIYALFNALGMEGTIDELALEYVTALDESTAR